MNGNLKAGGFLLAFCLFACALLVADSSRVLATVPYIAERVNLTSSGSQMTSGNLQGASFSQNGRYVAFATSASDIVAGDTNNAPDVFVRDRKLGTNVRATLTSTGGQIATYDSSHKISGNGRFVLFVSGEAGIVSGDTNNKSDLFLRDLKNGTTEMVSLTSSGGLPNNSTSSYDVSADGRYVTFTSSASNIVTGDANNKSDVFVRDRKSGTTVLLSGTSASSSGNGSSIKPAISCDGAYVAFLSAATDLVTGDTNGKMDIFLVNRVGGGTISNLTINANDNSGGSGSADISCNGETIVFRSDATNLVTGDTNNAPDIFAYSMIDDTFERVNLDPSGNETVWALNPGSGVQPTTNASIDFSGQYIVFEAATTTLVAGDTNNVGDVFLRDIKNDTTQIISKRNSTTQATVQSGNPSISLDGAEVMFISSDSGYVSGDTNSSEDVFVSKTGI